MAGFGGWRTVAALIVMAAGLAGCASAVAGATPPSAQSRDRLLGSPAQAATRPSHSFGQIAGSPAAPLINRLAARGSLLTDYPTWKACLHPFHQWPGTTPTSRARTPSCTPPWSATLPPAATGCCHSATSTPTWSPVASPPSPSSSPTSATTCTPARSRSPTPGSTACSASWPPTRCGDRTPAWSSPSTRAPAATRGPAATASAGVAGSSHRRRAGGPARPRRHPLHSLLAASLHRDRVRPALPRPRRRPGRRDDPGRGRPCRSRRQGA